MDHLKDVCIHGIMFRKLNVHKCTFSDKINKEIWISDYVAAEFLELTPEILEEDIKKLPNFESVGNVEIELKGYLKEPLEKVAFVIEVYVHA